MSPNLFIRGGTSLTGAVANETAWFATTPTGYYRIKPAIDAAGIMGSPANLTYDLVGQTASTNIVVVQGAVNETDGLWVEMLRITSTATGRLFGLSLIVPMPFMRVGWALHSGTTTSATVKIDRFAKASGTGF